MPRPRIVASIVAAVLLAGSLADPVFAEWRRIGSPNSVVVGDVSAGELREITRRFESFREVLARVLTERFIASAVPTVVVVFRRIARSLPSSRSSTARRIEVSGLFLPRRDVNYIAMVRDWDEDTMRRVPRVLALGGPKKVYVTQQISADRKTSRVVAVEFLPKGQ